MPIRRLNIQYATYYSILGGDLYWLLTEGCCMLLGSVTQDL